MAIDNMNDILSLATILVCVLVPLYYFIKVMYEAIQKLNAKRYEKLMKEDDWHM